MCIRDRINNYATFILRVHAVEDDTDLPKSYFTRVNDTLRNLRKYDKMWDDMSEAERRNSQLLLRNEVLSEWERFKGELAKNTRDGKAEFLKFQMKTSAIAVAVKEFSRESTRPEWLTCANAFSAIKEMYYNVLEFRRKGYFEFNNQEPRGMGHVLIQRRVRFT